MWEPTHLPTTSAAQLLLALAAPKASTLRGCTLTSTTATATSTTAAAASTTSATAATTSAAATDAPTPSTTSTTTSSASSTSAIASLAAPSTTLAPLAPAVAAFPTRGRRSYDLLSANEVDMYEVATAEFKPLGGGRGGGAASMKSTGNESESRDDHFPGQFFFVSTQAPAGPEKDEGFEEPAAVGKVTLHSLDYWVIDSGATYSMTPRADLLTELEPSPVKHVTSALGQRAEVKGMGKAMFKGANGKMVGLKNVLWVPNLAANLISVRRLQKAGMDTSSKGAKTYTARLGERILWNLHEDSKLSEHEESGAAAKEQHKGEENPKAAAEEEHGENMWGTIASAAFSNPTSATGECDWLTLHWRMGHVALPILQQLVKE
ncbi:unnamed protein product [Closterium sp. NIES-53]